MVALHDQPMQQHRHGDMGIVRQRVQRQCPVRGQFRDQPFRQRLDDIFFFLGFGRLAADGDDHALRSPDRRDGPIRCGAFAIILTVLHGASGASFSGWT